MDPNDPTLEPLWRAAEQARRRSRRVTQPDRRQRLGERADTLLCAIALVSGGDWEPIFDQHFAALEG